MPKAKDARLFAAHPRDAAAMIQRASGCGFTSLKAAAGVNIPAALSCQSRSAWC